MKFNKDTEVSDLPLKDPDFALKVLLRNSDGREESREFLRAYEKVTRAEALVLFIADEAISEIYPVASLGDEAQKIYDCMTASKKDLLNRVISATGSELVEGVNINVHRFDETTVVMFAMQKEHLGALGLLNHPPIGDKECSSLYFNAIHLLLSIRSSRRGRNLALRGNELDRSRQRLEKAYRQNSSDKKMVESLVAELTTALNTAELASQAKSEFLARMSHELRTPLHAILGFSQLLIASAGLNSEQRDYLGHVYKAGNHLLDLINEVLELSAVESGALASNPVQFDVIALLNECVGLMLGLAGEEDITILDKASMCDPLIVTSDKTRLKQVLINLVSNAIKYNERGGTVTLECTSLADGFEITVTDTGAGMTKNQIQMLFEPFARLVSDQSYIEGTGLGLVICKRIIETLGGSLVVKSVLGEGSAFSIRLPYSFTEEVLL